MDTPRLLSDYPWVVVNLSCKLCTRRGRYRLVRLAARYGPDIALDRLLADLACDCPYWNSRPREYDPRCGARFEDLDRLRPRDVPAGGPIHRQREPSRESMPQRRPSHPDPSGSVPFLSDWTAPQIVVTCAKCGRRDIHETADIRRMATPATTLIEVRLALTADCPKAIAQVFTDWCAGMLVAG